MILSVELDPLTIWNIFYYFFGNFLDGDTDEKVDLGNKERPNDHNIQNLHAKHYYTQKKFKILILEKRLKNHNEM